LIWANLAFAAAGGGLGLDGAFFLWAERPAAVFFSTARSGNAPAAGGAAGRTSSSVSDGATAANEDVCGVFFFLGSYVLYSPLWLAAATPGQDALLYPGGCVSVDGGLLSSARAASRRYSVASSVRAPAPVLRISPSKYVPNSAWFLLLSGKRSAALSTYSLGSIASVAKSMVRLFRAL